MLERWAAVSPPQLQRYHGNRGGKLRPEANNIVLTGVKTPVKGLVKSLTCEANKGRRVSDSTMPPARDEIRAPAHDPVPAG